MRVIFLIASLSLAQSVSGQQIYDKVPAGLDVSRPVIIYLHGGIVQHQGPDAVSEYYGKYEYNAILEHLSAFGSVISEVRPPETNEVTYAHKVNAQIDSLQLLGFSLDQITIVGASLGAYIAVEASIIRHDPELRMVLLGLCSNYAVEYYREKPVCGQILSVYETTDSKSSCEAVFENNACGMFDEIAITTGEDHGFLYRPMKEWLNPVHNWVYRK